MHDIFDRLENRTRASREGALFRDLQHVLGMAKGRTPFLRTQLNGVDVSRLRSRADLVRIPLRRRADLLAAQEAMLPFGGRVATRVGALAHVFGTPGTVATASGQAKDWWGMARAFYAAGLRRGALVLNAYPYDLTPEGHMADAGARALACPVLPAGGAEPARVVEAIARFRPVFFCGAAERLRQILDAGLEGGVDLTSLEAALVTGPMKFGLRREFGLRGLRVHHALTLPEVGLVAFETDASGAMILAEGLILEIVDPATGVPVGGDRTGELVVTRINRDVPLLRFATGLKGRVLDQPSSCGRTNTRVALLADPAPGGARPDDGGNVSPHLSAVDDAVGAAPARH